MKIRKHKELLLAERIAGEIDDPVARLGFLRSKMSPTASSHRYQLACFVLSLLVSMLFTSHAAAPVAQTPHAAGDAADGTLSPAKAGMQDLSQIWPVEEAGSFESYSNGLHIYNAFAVASHPRSYLTFSVKTGETDGERRTIPAGIVFHTTESLQVPFEPERSATLRHVSESLVGYVAHKRAYNFLIDRFGRVYRVVRESDAANHSGKSVWADSEQIYLNLNESFLGVALESQTRPGQVEPELNPAQVWSALLLTGMLRQRYAIPAANCVTHAQVSVNTAGMLVGYHMDWASSFPFHQVGLPDNYAVPLPAISVFGFEYDSNFSRRAGPRLLDEAEIGDKLLRERAAAAGMPISAYRNMLRKTFLKDWNAVREARPTQMENFENDEEHSGAFTGAAARSE